MGSRNRIESTRWQRTRRSAIAITLLLATGTTAAHAGGLLEEPCFATCGQYRWYLNQPVEVRENAACCMRLIRIAKQLEERALEAFEASRAPGLENFERSDLVREGNRLIKKRGRRIRQFIDCVNGVKSALAMFERGFDVTAEYAAACGVALECSEPDVVP